MIDSASLRWKGNDLAETPVAAPGVSILEGLIRFFEATSPLRLSFEDLSGILSDVKDLALPSEYCIHTCDFCRFAKSQRAIHQDCIRNKIATNRLMVRRRYGMSGQCHLGLTDIVEPLIYRDQVLGVFYCGSVRVAEREEQSRQRILAYARRRKLNVASFLSRFKAAPRVSEADISIYRDRLKLIVNVCGRVIEAHGLPVDRYRPGSDAGWAAQRRMPIPVKVAMWHVRANYAKSLSLEEVAELANCHPDTLCRVFRRHLGYGLGEYVKRVRIDHARHLISLGRLSLGEISFQVGFQDPSHFGRAFKSYLGCTPGEYAERGEAAAFAHPANRSRPTLSGIDF